VKGKAKTYYMADTRSICGSNVMFWADNGYTSDLEKAKIFNQEDAQKQHNDRSTDVPYLVDKINLVKRKRVDMQYLPEKLKIEDMMDGDGAFCIRDNVYDGNDVSFVCLNDNGTRYSSFNFDDAFLFFEDELHDEKSNRMLKRCSLYDPEGIGRIVRYTVGIEDVNRRSMCNGIKIKHIKKKKGTCKVRTNCVECGKIMWVYEVREDMICIRCVNGGV